MCPYTKVDYYVYYNFERSFIINTINSYINKNNISKKKFAEDNRINYRSLLRFLNGEWVMSIEGYLGFLCHKIMSNNEKLINKKTKDLNLDNFEIDIIKAFCNLLINNNKKMIKIEGTNNERIFWDIIKFFNDNNVEIEILYSWGGRGDHDPYVEFKVSDYSVYDIENILKRLKQGED